MEFKHIPIMLNEVLSGLKINPDGIYLDCTLGGGGHSGAIVKKLSNNGKLIGIDKDIDAITFCKNKFSKNKNVVLANCDFSQFKKILDENSIDLVDGILLDLGVSSYQIDNDARGFSFRFDGPLDMRMDVTQKLSAYDVVNTYNEKELLHILYEYGEEKFAKAIVGNIIKQRKLKPISTTFELKKIIEDSYPKKLLFAGGVCKKTFQAIRIEVNGELETLKNTLDNLISKLKKGGRIAIITFHSLEDRIVKNCFKINSTDCICPPKIPKCICNHHASLKIINKKPITASLEEEKENSRSTCAKLRVAEKI